MMDTYDPRPHAHQPQFHASHPHYHNYAAYSYQQHHPVSLPADSSAIPTAIYPNNGTALRSGSAPSSHSGSGHSTPEGTYLDDFSYSTSVNQASSIPNVNSDSLIPSTSSNPTGLPTPPTTAGTSSMIASSSTQRSVVMVAGASGSAGAPSSSSSASVMHGSSLTRPLTHKEQDLLAHLDRLKFFLATAPSRWTDSEVRSDSEAAMVGGPRYQTGTPMMPHPNTHPALNRFLLPSGEYVTCVLWGGLYHITGTDIVRALVFRFEAFGRPVRNMKKFEEGVFSDLRNLKPGTDACLEEPKSQFLDLLFKYQCIRTQKKQKVFYWFSVPHDRLFLDALERDLKREKMGLEPTTQVVGEPALSFKYDPKRTLYEQFSKAQGAIEGESELETAVRRHEEAQREAQLQQLGNEDNKLNGDVSSLASSRRSTADYSSSRPGSAGGADGTASGVHGGTPFFNMFRLFEGSPNYKQRRKKGPKTTPSSLGPGARSGLAARDSSEDDVGMGGDDLEGEMSAAAMFDVGVAGGHGASKQEQAARQAEKQRQVQAQHLAILNIQHRSSVGQMHVPSNAIPQGYGPGADRYPSRSVHPSIVPTQAAMQRHPDSRHTYPLMADSTAHAHASSLPPNMVAGANSLPLMPGAQHRSSVGGTSGTGKTKVFMCPLMTCNKLFKRMEHLKRHIRTHTMEKPFECEVCHRRFSRADNLSQHVRTHAKDGMNSAQSMYAAGDAGTDADVEEDDGMAAAQYADNMALSMPGLDFSTCEIEVSDGAQDIQFGDDEEMMNAQAAGPGASGYYNTETPQFAHVVMSPENSPNLLSGQLQNESPGVQWATTQQQQHPAPNTVGFDAYNSPQPSPAFSSVSAPSPQASNMSHNVAAMMLNAPTSGNYRMHGGDYAGSMSAPSHKQVFDHANLYPPSLGIGNASTSSGPGPVRRYRSVTPTIARSSESIRRPSTAVTDSLTGAVSRAYHPYSIPSSQYASGSTGSNHSSPVPYHTTTDYHASMDQQQRNLSRQGSQSHSRSNSLNANQQMMTAVETDPSAMYSDVTSAAAAAVAAQSAYGDMYTQASGRDVSGQYTSAGEGVGGASYYSTSVPGAGARTESPQGLYPVSEVGINEAGHYQPAAVVPSPYYDAVSSNGRSGAAI